MKPYSSDLRERVAAAVDRGDHSLRQLARLFAVSLSFIVRLLRRRRATGAVHPAPHGGGTPRTLDAPALARLLDLVRAQPDATLAELRDRLGVPCSLATIGRNLQRLHITRTRKTTRAAEQDTPEVRAKRADFDRRMADVDPARLVFLDETGSTTAMTRAHGRAPAGERVAGAVPAGWQTLTLIAGLRADGVIAPFVFTGGTDADAFRTYVTEVLAPELRPGDVVVWDNLTPHADPGAVAAVGAARARVERLPPHSPDKTPIEELFSKTKEYLRSVGARTVEAVTAAWADALRSVTPRDVQGWFHHRAAYAFQ